MSRTRTPLRGLMSGLRAFSIVSVVIFLGVSSASCHDANSPKRTPIAVEPLTPRENKTPAEPVAAQTGTNTGSGQCGQQIRGLAHALAIPLGRTGNIEIVLTNR